MQEGLGIKPVDCTKAEPGSNLRRIGANDGVASYRRSKDGRLAKIDTSPALRGGGSRCPLGVGAFQKIIRPSRLARPERPVSASPSSPNEGDPSLQLPQGALPPKWPRKLTRQEWWYVNKPLIVALTGLVAFLVALWVINNVPIVSVTNSFDGTVTTADHFTNLTEDSTSPPGIGFAQTQVPCSSTNQGISFMPNDTGLVLLESSTIGTEARFTATYSDPSGTPIWVWAFLGGTSCFDTNTSGSFAISAPGHAWPAEINFETPVPATVYVNATYSYLAPLAAVL